MNKKIPASFFLLFLLFAPLFSFAAVPSEIQINGVNDFWIVIVTVLNFIWPVFVGFAIIMFFVAGFLYLTSAGDPGKTKAARDSFIWSIIGMIVGIMAVSLPYIIGTAIGL
ncbi:MAG: hypothetical protein Q7S10_01655 [bacterium]|nr:hypothetical protein [bacterium]